MLSSTRFNLKFWLVFFAVSILSLLLFLVFARTAMALAPKFNQHSGTAYSINDGSRRFNNVSPGEGNAYEGDFFRVGETWTRNGSGMTGTLEICDESQIINLWAYAHNGANFRDNHTGFLSDKSISYLEGRPVNNQFNFNGNGVLRNANIKIRHSGKNKLDSSVFANTHRLEVVLTAEHRSGTTIAPLSQSITISCADHKIALNAQGLETPSIRTWGSETTYANYKARHNKAQSVFGGKYSLDDPSNIFSSSGTAFGYNGWVPASRYYAAYIKAQLQLERENCEDRGDCPEPNGEVAIICRAHAYVVVLRSLSWSHKPNVDLHLQITDYGQGNLNPIGALGKRFSQTNNGDSVLLSIDEDTDYSTNIQFRISSYYPGSGSSTNSFQNRQRPPLTRLPSDTNSFPERLALIQNGGDPDNCFPVPDPVTIPSPRGQVAIVCRSGKYFVSLKSLLWDYDPDNDPATSPVDIHLSVVGHGNIVPTPISISGSRYSQTSNGNVILLNIGKSTKYPSAIEFQTYSYYPNSSSNTKYFSNTAPVVTLTKLPNSDKFSERLNKIQIGKDPDGCYPPPVVKPQPSGAVEIVCRSEAYTVVLKSLDWKDNPNTDLHIKVTDYEYGTPKPIGSSGKRYAQTDNGNVILLQISEDTNYSTNLKFQVTAYYPDMSSTIKNFESSEIITLTKLPTNTASFSDRLELVQGGGDPDNCKCVTKDCSDTPDIPDTGSDTGSENSYLYILPLASLVIIVVAFYAHRAISNHSRR